MPLVLRSAVLLLAGASSPFASGQDSTPVGVFRHISIEQGLSDSHVRSIVQDHQGFLWFATADGLNRFDGYQMRIFRGEPGNPRSLGSNFVYTLFVDRSGRLWAGTLGGGLHRFDPLTEDFVRYQHDPNDSDSLADNQVHAICDDRTGALWVATSKGLDRMDASSGRFRHYRHDPRDPESLSHDDVYSVIEDRAGTLWAATYGGGLNRMVEAGGRFVRYPHDPESPDSLANDLTRVVYEDKEGGLWVGTWGGGLNKFDPSRGSFERYDLGLSSTRIATILEDVAGDLWVGAAGAGLSRFDRTTNSFESYRHDPAEPRGLSHDNVVSVHEDREGLLWVGTGGGGVNVLDLARKPFATVRLVSSGPAGGGLLPDVRDVLEDREGTLWIGTLGEGLYAANERGHSLHNYRNDPRNPWSLSSDVVLSIAQGSRGVLWIGTSSGLNKLDLSTGRFHRYDRDVRAPGSLNDPEVISVLEDQVAGAVWVGTSKGLSCLDPGTGKFTRYPREPSGDDRSDPTEVRAILKDGKGALWLARSVGLERLDSSTGRSKYYSLGSDPGSSEIGVWAIHEGENGRLWLGTSAGLLSFDSDTGSVRQYADPPETRFGMVGSILQDGEGGLWLGRSRGVARFDPRTEEFRYYGSDELHLRQGFLMGAFKSRNGRLFFGAGDGLLAFDPSEIRDSSYVPPMVLTGLQVANRTVPIGEDSVLKQSITKTEALTLPAQDRVLSLEFAALSYRAPRKNRYRYRLEGFDSEWTEVDSGRRVVTYTNLRPGGYVFRLMGSNNDGIWNEKGATLRLQVLPFWWQNWWFRGGGLVVAALALRAAHRLRLRAVEKRAAELQREVEARETAEVALREREERNRSVLESLKSHIALLDREGRITAANERWSTFVRADVGVDYAGILRRAAGEGDKKAEEALSGIESVLEGKEELFDLEYPHPAPSGMLWYLMTVVPFRGQEGGAVVSFTDITERRRAVEEAQKRREELAHVARVATVGELTASIAHEINQPLASIVTYANAGRRFLDGGSSAPEEVRGILRAIAEQGKRAGDIILHLRELLRKGGVDRVRLDVNELIRAVLQLVHGDALAKGVSMRGSLAGELPRIPGNPIELQQVMLNLLANGFEAMSQSDEGPRELLVRTWSDGGKTIEIALTDTGPPISEETFSKMFHRFYTGKPTGLGMGLSISQSIVAAHGGTLWAERNPERGLTMRVSLPTQT